MPTRTTAVRLAPSDQVQAAGPCLTCIGMMLPVVAAVGMGFSTAVSQALQRLQAVPSACVEAAAFDTARVQLSAP